MDLLLTLLYVPSSFAFLKGKVWLATCSQLVSVTVTWNLSNILRRTVLLCLQSIWVNEVSAFSLGLVLLKCWSSKILLFIGMHFSPFTQHWGLLICVLKQAKIEQRLLNGNWAFSLLGGFVFLFCSVLPFLAGCLLFFFFPPSKFQSYAPLGDGIGKLGISSQPFCARYLKKNGWHRKHSGSVLFEQLWTVWLARQWLVSPSSFHSNQQTLYHSRLREGGVLSSGGLNHDRGLVYILLCFLFWLVAVCQ